MAQSIIEDRYPKFVADQVLTEKSLNQMFGYLEEQQRLTRTTLIGIGVLCGMEVSINATGTALTISEGVGVTSKGYLVPFPTTTYTFYNDTFSAEQEEFYDPFLDGDVQKFPLNLLHNNGADDDRKPITPTFLRNKIVVIFVELLRVDNKNCDPDSCDDKGCTMEVTHRPLLIDKANLDDLVYSEGDSTFFHKPTCIEWPALKMLKYNVPSTMLLSSPKILENFLNILDSNFLLRIEGTLGAAYSSFGYYIRDEFPNNPFSGLRNNFSFLFDGSINEVQLLNVQYYYDFFSDLILGYEELREICNECLSLCCPNEMLFPRHLILGCAISKPDEFRHHWIQSPAFTCGGCSEGRIKFLLKKLVLLVQKVNIPRGAIGLLSRENTVKITPSNYGRIPLSDKAIPYYYDINGAPNELYNNWNFKKTKLEKGHTNLSYDASSYTTDPYYNTPLDYDLEPFNFLRVEGHIGLNWKNALAQVNQIKREKRLPIDVVALNGDVFALIQSLLTNENSLAEILQGDPSLLGEVHCYFADIESQYDAHAAELRCAIAKIMAFFYNLPIPKGVPAPTTNVPASQIVRDFFPAYRTKTNTFGALFDAGYPAQKNDPYTSLNAFLNSGNFQNPDGSLNEAGLAATPYGLMYYMEKIYEVLPDGLVQLNLIQLTTRLDDAGKLAAAAMLTYDFKAQDLPASYEETLDAIIRICKGEVFKVLYKNFLINYVLFISNQTFALHAYKNPGIQHKAGVTVGGTLILVYNDKPEVRATNQRATGNVLSNSGAPIVGASVVERNTTNGAQTDFNGSFSMITTSANPVLVISFVGFETKEVIVDSANLGNIVLNELTFSRTARAAESEGEAVFNTVKNTASSKSTNNPFMDLRESDESVKKAGLEDTFSVIDEATADDLSDKELQALVNQFPEGTVIADFFVPNMCKSSCNPMNFVVLGEKETKPGETNTELDIKLREYCEDDEGDYEIRVAPTGGVLTIDGESRPVGTRFAPGDFPVANQASREILITYTINGDVKNIRVVVYKKPTVEIRILEKDDDTRTVIFENNTDFAYRYEWDFGRGIISTEEDPGEINFDSVDEATVILTAFNGPCENQSNPLRITFETNSPPPTILRIPVDEFCEDDDSEIDVTMSPEGGELSVDGEIINNPTTYKFVPNNFDIETSVRTIPISYNANNDVKIIIVQVFKKPVIAIGEASINHTTKTVTYTNTTEFATQFDWVFSNGNTSTNRIPGRQQYTGSTGVATLTAVNGPCSSSDSVRSEFKTQTPTEERTCTSIDLLGESFRVVMENGSDAFEKRIRDSVLLRRVFIVQFENAIVGKEQKVQFDAIRPHITLTVIRRVINDIDTILKEKGEDTIAAMLLYHILLQLLMFYACCQKQDIDKAQVATSNTFNVILDQFKEWKEQGDFKDNAKTIIANMFEAVGEELNKTKNETPEKVKYMEILEQLEECLEELLA